MPISRSGARLMQPSVASSPVPHGEALIAILRGVRPDNAVAVGQTVYEAQFRVIEVPLNSPDPFDSIARLRQSLPADCLVGAGTVLTAEDVRRCHAAGGRIVVAPNCDTDVIRAALQLRMRVLPGVATPTEALAAMGAGATELKLFPAITYGPAHLRQLRAIVPAQIAILPVGGVRVDDMNEWVAAGATGFGLGSELFRPDFGLEEVAQRAQRAVTAYRAARSS